MTDKPLLFNAFTMNCVSLIDHAVPVLQGRGLMRRAYEPGTLREKLRPGSGPRLPGRHPAASYRHTKTERISPFSSIPR